jgi:hypothetical protein
MKQYFRIGVIVAILWAAACGLSWARVGMPDVKTVTAWGETRLTEDPAADRERAIAQAQRNALEQIVGVYVSSSTLVRNFQIVEDNIYTKAAGFLNAYDVIQEKRGKGHRVRIRAQVSLVPVTDILKNSGLLRKWRVGVLISSNQRELTALLRYYSQPRLMAVVDSIETRIGRAVSKAGFKLVDPRHLQKLRKAADPSSLVDPEIAEGMDLLVTGSVSFASSSVGASIHQAACQIHGKVLRTDTGEIIYQGNVGNTLDGITLLVDRDLAEKYMNSYGNGQMADGTPDLRTYGSGVAGAMDKATQLAAAMAADVTVSQIMRIPAAARSTVVLEVYGSEFDDMIAIEDQLQKMEGVASVHIEGFGEGAKTIEVEYAGKTMTLAKTLNRSDALRRLGFKIKGVTQNKIVFKK